MEKFKSILIDKFGEQVILDASNNTLSIDSSSFKKICLELYQNEGCYFDSLSCLTGIDNGVEAETMEVIYNLYSIPLEHSLTLKVSLPRENPILDSICNIWRTADWHEREAYDLLGIKFMGHPDLRRLLMPADWAGFPLRKDYKEPELYRGMKTVREDD